jgi:2-polyprenyl-3-methyl-5-hydroxy-6-metoxy-1,4-benzoquinol methylase
MEYTQRTNENQDRTDELRYYGKECYVHADETRLDETVAYWKKSSTVFALERYKHHLKGRLCDIGCGFGILPLILLESKIISYAVGVDYFQRAIDVANVYAKHLKLENQIEFKQMNFADVIDLQVESFDSVMSFHTLEHIYLSDHDRFVDNIFRILKPGGVVVISVPFDHQYGSQEHVSFFVKDSLVELFERHYFKTVEVEHLESYCFLTGIFCKPINTGVVQCGRGETADAPV